MYICIRINRYNAKWYAAPICMQKLILLIMQRSIRKSSLTAGGLFDASLEGFATVRNYEQFSLSNCIQERDF